MFKALESTRGLVNDGMPRYVAPQVLASNDASNFRRIVLLWLVTRAWLSLWVLFCSAFFPITTFEQEVAAWPPSIPLEDWFARVILAPWNRWDVEHFVKIATDGYRVDNGTVAFHPLYPLLGKMGGMLINEHALSGLFIVSNICSMMFLIVLERLVRLDVSREDAFRSCFFFLMLPTAFVIFAPYTEALFLLCSVAAFLMARRGRWWLAGMLGGLAALTRQQGILLVLPLAWEFWEGAQRDWRELFRRWRGLLGLALTPAGLAAWLVYRNWILGDIQFNWSEPHTLLHGLFISSSASQVIPGQHITFPWQALWLAVSHPGPTNLIDLLTGGFYLCLLVAGGRQLWRLRPAYLLYSLAIVIASFSYSTGLPYSYISLARHCLLAFPVAILLAAMTRTEIMASSMTAVGLLGLLGLPALYVWKTLWVP